jgi:hypothetical protein
VSLLLLSAASHIAVLAHDGKELLLADENPAVAAAMLVVTLFPLLLLLTRVVPHACQDYVIASCVEVRTRQQKERNEGDNRPLAPFGCDTIVLSRKKLPVAKTREFKHNTKETLKLLPVLLVCSVLFWCLSSRLLLLVRS